MDDCADRVASLVGTGLCICKRSRTTVARLADGRADGARLDRLGSARLGVGRRGSRCEARYRAESRDTHALSSNQLPSERLERGERLERLEREIVRGRNECHNCAARESDEADIQHPVPTRLDGGAVRIPRSVYSFTSEKCGN